jgi:excisionase family DNA binding protein
VTIEIQGQVYYQTSEACKKIGISRATLYRWLKAGVVKTYFKDRRGWKLFTQENIDLIRAEARKIEKASSLHED